MQEKLKSKRLNVEELFSMAAHVYKKNFKTIAIVTTAIFILMSLLQLFVVVFGIEGMDSFFAEEYVFGIPASSDSMLYEEMMLYEDIISNSIAYILYALVSLLIIIVLQPLISISIIYGSLNVIKGEKNSVKENFLYAFSKVPDVFLTNLLQCLFLFAVLFLMVMVVGLLAAFITPIMILLLWFMVIPILYFLVIWVFTDQVIAIQNVRGIQAVKMSSRTVKISFWKVLFYFVIFSIVIGILSFAIRLVLGMVFSMATYFMAAWPIYTICYYISDLISSILFDGFFITFMTVLFLNHIWGPFYGGANYGISSQNRDTDVISMDNSEIKEVLPTVSLEKWNAAAENTNERDSQSEEAAQTAMTLEKGENTAQNTNERDAQSEEAAQTAVILKKEENTAQNTNERDSQSEETAQTAVTLKKEENAAENTNERNSQSEETAQTAMTLEKEENAAENTNERNSQSEEAAQTAMTLEKEENAAENTNERNSQSEEAAQTAMTLEKEENAAENTNERNSQSEEAAQTAMTLEKEENAAENTNERNSQSEEAAQTAMTLEKRENTAENTNERDAQSEENPQTAMTLEKGDAMEQNTMQQQRDTAEEKE